MSVLSCTPGGREWLFSICSHAIKEIGQRDVSSQNHIKTRSDKKTNIRESL